MVDENRVRIWARELGFEEFALCSLEDFERVLQQTQDQPQLSERRQLRFRPMKEYPQAKSLAVLLWPYTPREPGREEDLFVDSYYRASNAAYHAARQLETYILESGGFARANVSFPAKSAAVRAGLGFIGKNSLLYTERFGSRVVIILMATDIEITGNDHCHQERTCLACGACFMACPAAALDEKGMSHPERCLRNFMMEGVPVPAELRRKMGMGLIGCDICQRVCPMQPSFDAQKRTHFALDSFITEDQAAFSDAVASLAQEIGRNAARPQRVRAQAALLAGNSRNPAYLPVLRSWADSAFDAVREHAKWAIEQIEFETGGT